MRIVCAILAAPLLSIGICELVNNKSLFTGSLITVGIYLALKALMPKDNG